MPWYRVDRGTAKAEIISALAVRHRLQGTYRDPTEIMELAKRLNQRISTPYAEYEFRPGGKRASAANASPQ